MNDKRLEQEAEKRYPYESEEKQFIHYCQQDIANAQREGWIAAKKEIASTGGEGEQVFNFGFKNAIISIPAAHLHHAMVILDEYVLNVDDWVLHGSQPSQVTGGEEEKKKLVVQNLQEYAIRLAQKEVPYYAQLSTEQEAKEDIGIATSVHVEVLEKWQQALKRIAELEAGQEAKAIAEKAIRGFVKVNEFFATQEEMDEELAEYLSQFEPKQVEK